CSPAMRSDSAGPPRSRSCRSPSDPWSHLHLRWLRLRCCRCCCTPRRPASARPPRRAISSAASSSPLLLVHRPLERTPGLLDRAVVLPFPHQEHDLAAHLERLHGRGGEVLLHHDQLATHVELHDVSGDGTQVYDLADVPG